MIGVLFPAGVDSVLPVELTETHSEKVFAVHDLFLGKNLGNIGEDIRIGEVVLSVGCVLCL